jgi:hypothetical protein
MHSHLRNRWFFAGLFFLSASAAAATTSYTGMCDASAAVMLDADKFVVANDDDVALRIYSLAKPGEPVSTDPRDLREFLKLEKKKADIEGAARIGNRIYWITSHGTDGDGDPKPDRRRFFATDIVSTKAGISVAPIGMGTRNIEALFSTPTGKRYNLKEKAAKPPESDDGLNIEGLAPGPAGSVLIGFRNPIPHGHALLVTLKNPEALVKDPKTLPQFGNVIELDLGGLGIRSIDTVPGTGDYLIAAGPINDGPFALYRWRHGKKPDRMNIAMPDDFHPEALMVSLDGKQLHMLSDDGDDACKKGDRPAAFRLLTVSLPAWQGEQAARR